MEIWLVQGSSELCLPVLPPEYTISSGQINTTVNINALGEINLLGKKGLRAVSFSSFFPQRRESYCEYSGIDDPEEYIAMLEDMKQNGPLELLMTGIVDMNVSIEDFEYGESDGTGDISYTINLKEHPTISIPVSVIVAETPVPEDSGARDTTGKDKTATYTVVKGDTLSGIARKLTGSANWQPLYNANKGTIGGNPNKIQIGMVLTIP